MAFTRAPVTALASFGAPGPIASAVLEAQSTTDTVSVSVTDTSSLLVFAAISASDTVSVSVSESSALLTAEVSSYVTELGVWGAPRPHQVLEAVAPSLIFNLDVSDTLSVQWLEEPVDENQIVSSDNLRVSLTEVSSLLNHIQVVDAVSVQLSETISLLQSAVTLKTASDTLSVTLTETSAVNVTLAVTDTVSVSVSDTSSLLTPTEAIVVTDTLSVSVTEAAPLLGVFTGILDVTASDILVVSASENAIRADYVPPTATRPFRIRIIPRTARIRIVPQ